MHAAKIAHVRPLHLQVLGQPARVFVGGNGPPTLLMLHGGWGGASMHFSRVWGLLSQHFRIVAPDLPGLGDLTQPGRSCLADYVTWLNDLLDMLGVRQAIVLGNSFGASLAWSFASRSPERCQGLVLVDGFAVPHTPALLGWLGRLAPGRSLMRALVRQVSFRPPLLADAFADPRRAPAELRGWLVDMPQRRLETFVDCLIAGDGSPRPRVPMLVIWGEADHLPGTSLAAGRHRAASLPGALFVPVAHAGHFPQVEQPEAFAAAVDAFALSASAPPN